MSNAPANLALRFLLELAALGAFAAWAVNRVGGTAGIVLAVALPVIAALLWGTFAVPDDPSRSGQAPIPVSGSARLLLELAFFALATAALFDGGYTKAAFALGGVATFHYLISYDRIRWLLATPAPERPEQAP